jgi:hypothetical protein
MHLGVNRRLPGMATRSARRLLAVITFLVTATVVAMHSPGHVSMDTSIQLYEALTGTSISWNPPFMSALMRWLGGGEVATTALVLISTVLIYGAYLLVADCLLTAREANGEQAVGLLLVLTAAAVVLNPVVAILAGVVWKDVLFGALLAAGSAFGIVVVLQHGTPRAISLTAAVLCLAAAFLTRQQGVFMAPVLLLILLARDGLHTALWRGLALAAGFALAVWALSAAANTSIAGNGGRSSSQGFRSIMIFDMLGVVAHSPRPAGEFAFPISDTEAAAVRRVYQPSRIDYIARDPVAEGWVAALSPQKLRAAWWSLVKQNPGAYVSHRVAAYATLLGLRGIAETLPVHVGVDGNQEYLRAVMMTERNDAKDRFIYRFAASQFRSPWYRHAFWLAALALCSVLVAYSRLTVPLRRAAWCILTATGLLFASYGPTMISSDFRYLFGAIPLIGIVVLILLFGMRSPASAKEEARSRAATR